MKREFRHRCLAIAIVVLPLLFASALAQGTLNLKKLMSLPGKLIGEAKSAQPSGALKLTGYRVEEVQLPSNQTVQLRGEQAVVDKAWRVTVQGGPFPVRAMPATIWIDDEIVGIGVENETLSQITAITFDGALIRAGSVISVSYGEDKTARVKVSPRLQLKREGGNQ
ncbi:MAG TPA: hypothetical protein VFI24_20915 [Pyrinomonadaceae bacterium]|nr:hypothetical protein [Pyrinomonadaceae bacterium]